MRKLPILTSLATALIALSAPVKASSEDAWEEFRAEVEAACRSTTEDIFEAPEIIVDPFGSESYGIAIVTGLERGGDGTPRSIVCIFDKVSRSAEVGTPLDIPALQAP